MALLIHADFVKRGGFPQWVCVFYIYMLGKNNESFYLLNRIHECASVKITNHCALKICGKRSKGKYNIYIEVYL